MSIGLDDMQNVWQKFGMGGSSSSNSGGFATMQNSSATTAGNLAASSVNANANIPGINGIEMPSWLSADPNKNIGELTSTYAGIGAAFDPTAQVQARNNAIGYNTSAGTQAANNAATEYANRAAQSGASSLGAGVVKGQAMMPVLTANAQLKTDAADVAAKAHQDAATLSGQIASTIGQLRMSYLSTLTGYATGQQQLALSKYQAQQQVAGQAAQNQLGYASLQQQSKSSTQAAALALLGQKSPSASYWTDNTGQVTNGQSSYNALKSWQANQFQATNALKGLL